MRAIVRAACCGDADEFAHLWLNFEREATDEQRGLAGVCVWYLVEYRVHDILQRRPAPTDLHELAGAAGLRFAKIIKENEVSLESVLRTVFKVAASAEQVTGGRLIVGGSAALAALLDDAAQLDTMRAPFARWFATHSAEFRALGSFAPPRSTS